MPFRQRGIFLIYLLLLLTSCLLYNSRLQAEGSVDFINYSGSRLFYNASVDQQLKVYVAAGDFLHFGTSHLGIEGGFMTVFRPDGSVYATYDGSDGLGIINNNIEERNGPTGGGTSNGTGYIPNIIEVGAQESGIWTIVLDYPSHNFSPFANLANNAPWTRTANQPTNRRVILAWDISVSQNLPINEGGVPIKGRLFSNEYVSIIQNNGTTTSPVFYVLSKQGYQYKLQFNDADPFGFPISANSTGLTFGNQLPAYQSANTTDFTIDANIDTWVNDELYLYPPQARDTFSLINHKLFFNPPDGDMPTSALNTDIFTNETYETWLFNAISPVIFGASSINMSLQERDSFIASNGIGIIFQSNQEGIVNVSIDINSNQLFEDSLDVQLSKFTSGGQDTIFWNGQNGLGESILLDSATSWATRLSIRAGEIHIFYQDVENDLGGLNIIRLNGENLPDSTFFYDHSAIGGPISGNNTSDSALPVTKSFIYNNNFGNERLLDHWAFAIAIEELIDISVLTAEDTLVTDIDRDSIPDYLDLDDDNDGIPDSLEIQLATNDGDTDQDGIPDYQDLDSDNDGINDVVESGNIDNDGDGRVDGEDTNQDGLVDTVMPPSDTDLDGILDYQDLDSDNDGIPDSLEIQLATNDGDTDQDGIPDYQDLDSDNDGINDVVESGNVDNDGDGRVDGEDTNQDGLVDTAIAPSDTDLDGIVDYQDLDSDNDGIPDSLEIQLATNDGDTDQDGIPDYQDLDSDNDTYPDSLECPTGIDCLDFDRDGLPDVIDSDCSQVSLPQIDIVNNNNILCGNNTLNLIGINRNPTSFLVNTTWTGPANFFELTENSPSDSFAINLAIDSIEQTGWYTFSVLSQQEACTLVIDSIFIEVDSLLGQQPVLAISKDTVCAGSDIAFTVSADMSESTSFRWEYWVDSTWLPLEETALPFFILTDANTANRTKYRVAILSEDCPTTLSNEVNLFVFDSFIEILAENSSSNQENTCIGDSVVFTVDEILGATYHWTGPGIDTIEEQSFTLEGIRLDNEGAFFVEIRAGNCYSVVSNPTLLNLTLPIIETQSDSIFLESTDSTVSVNLVINDSLPANELWDFQINTPVLGEITEESEGQIIYQNRIDAAGLDSTTYVICSLQCPEICDSAQVFFIISPSQTDCPFLDSILIDTDGDGIFDNQDIDSDNDGIPDLLEMCLDTSNCPLQGIDPDGDIDGDCILNYLDADDPAFSLACEDVDSNGVCDVLPFWLDIDADNIPNHLDLDSDNDGITDLIEARPDFDDINGDGRLDGSDNDFGLNGLFNLIATDADDLSAWIVEDIDDADADGIPNYKDLDSDNDGFQDIQEGDLRVFDLNFDGFIDNTARLPQVNQDGIANVIDPTLTGEPIPYPNDSDGDGVYNFLDLDSDNDGVGDVIEGGNPDPNNDGMIGIMVMTMNALGQILEDSSGTVFLPNEGPLDTDRDGVFNFLDLDSDNDGLNDVLEAGGIDQNGDGFQDGMFDEHTGTLDVLLNAIDTDGDGIANNLDLDSDNDGVGDLIENGMASSDANNDGIVDGIDTDGDGILDLEDGLPDAFGDSEDKGLLQSDTDSLPDYLDLDSDGDGIRDLAEIGFSSLDQDNNGMLDTIFLDVDDDGINDLVDKDTTVFGGISAADNDKDGVINILDLDSDNDGIADSIEISLAINKGDSDGDGIADYLDLDSDNDGIMDALESGNIDEDGNGEADGIDTNRDGIIDEAITPLDTDSDGRPNYIDLDSDNDGNTDLIESGNDIFDQDGNSQVDGIDSDGDGLPNSIDNIPAIYGNEHASEPIDGDGDSSPDFLDSDSDNDGIPDLAENGLDNFDNDKNGFLDEPIIDEDRDGISSLIDNDSIFGAALSLDLDNDGIPDDIDLDSDGDGILDSLEMLLARFGGDSDQDGIPDFRDLDSDNDGLPDVLENGGIDDNQDGQLDGADTNQDGIKETITSDIADTDGDGIPNYLDLDSDNDGIFDVAENGLSDLDNNGIIGIGQITIDGNGLGQQDSAGNDVLISFNIIDTDEDGNGNFIDIDSDNDGIFDTQENNIIDPNLDGLAGNSPTIDIFGVPEGLATAILIDSDEDGLANIQDTDSDNDTYSDGLECSLNEQCPDFDQDGIPDYLDVDCSALSIPILDILDNTIPICEGDTLSLSSINTNPSPFLVSYEWSGPANFFIEERNSEADTFNIIQLITDNSQEGWYVFSAVSQQGQCPPVTDSVFIEIVDESERQPQITLSQDSICPNQTLTLFAETKELEPVRYDWYEHEDGNIEIIAQTETPFFIVSNPSNNSGYQVAAIFSSCPTSLSPIVNPFVFDTDFIVEAESSNANQPICVGETVSFTATAIPNAQYRWTGPGIDTIYQRSFNLDSIQLENEGNFFLQVSIGECFSVIANTVSIQLSPVVAPLQIMPVEPTCLGSSLTLEISDPIAEGNYDWFDADTDELVAQTDAPSLAFTNITASQAGAYYVRLAEEQCSSTASIPVEVEVLDTIIPEARIFTADTSICNLDRVILLANNTSPYKGSWSVLGAGQILQPDSNRTEAQLERGLTHTFTWTVTHQICLNQSTDTLRIFNAAPPSLMADAGLDQQLCLEDSTYLSALITGVDSNILGSWTSLGQATILDTNEAATGVNGLGIGENIFVWQLSTDICGVFSADSINIIVDTIPSVEARILTQDTSLCEIDDLMLIEGLPHPIGVAGSWRSLESSNIGQSNNHITSINNLSDSINTFIWELSTDICGVFDSDTLTINVFRKTGLEAVSDQLNLFFNEEVEAFDLLANDELPLELGWTLQVGNAFMGSVTDLGGGFISYKPKINFFGQDQLIYEICAQQCPTYCDTATVSFSVKGIGQEMDCFVPNVITPNNDGLNDALVIPCLEEFPNNSIRIFNRWGDLVFSTTSYKNNWQGTYRNTLLPEGTYFYLIQLSNDSTEQLSGYFTLVH